MSLLRILNRTGRPHTDGGGHPSASLATAETLARRGGFFRDTLSVADRALRSVRRDPEVTVPALFIPVFMYIVTVGALNDIAEGISGLNYRAFQIPVAVLFAVTGISRALVVVTDIQTGYFDRLAISPVNRLALLLGLMIADFAMVVALTVPVVIMAFIAGVNFATGVPGILVFMFLSGLWGLIFAGFPYAIALKTGNPAAVNISFLLFFPLLFTTTPVHAPGGDDRLVERGRRLQSGHLSTGCPPLTDLERLGATDFGKGVRCYPGCGSSQHRTRPGSPQESRHPQVARIRPQTALHRCVSAPVGRCGMPLLVNLEPCFPSFIWSGKRRTLLKPGSWDPLQCHYAAGGTSEETNPTMLPSGSLNWAKVTMPGMLVTGTIVFPPSSPALSNDAWMSSTST